MNEAMTDAVTAPPRLAPADAPIEMATFWRRWAAYFIDSIVLAIADFLVTIPLSLAQPLVSLSSSPSGSAVDLSSWWEATSALIRLAVPALYFVWAYSSGGQTIGKAILGIKVVPTDGSPLTLRTGILRTVGYVPSTIMFGLGFLWSLWDADKQAWQDKIAGTCVVRASVPREALLGRIDPDVARRRQRSWFVVLGALTALALAAFGLTIRAGVSEVTEMGPWPSRDVRPEQVAAIDLQHLGLTTVQVKDARSIKKWGSGNYRAGIMVTYSAEQQEIVAITALQYSDTATASSEFGSLTEWAKENCGWSTYSSVMNTGAIRCGFRVGHDRILWSGYWILDIITLDGGQLPSQELADKVRDAVAANWKQAQETRR